MRFAGWCSAGISILMLGQWTFFIVAGQVSELASEPVRISFHLTAEGVTALALIAAGILSALRSGSAARVGLVANGMLAYTAIASPGYFAQKSEWPMVAMFALILALAAANLSAFARPHGGRVADARSPGTSARRPPSGY